MAKIETPEQSRARIWGDGYKAGYSRGVSDAFEDSKEHHALWLKFGNTGSEYTDRWQCSGCKQTARAETWGRVCEYERCPHCGAIMGEYYDDDGSGVWQTFSPD